MKKRYRFCLHTTLFLCIFLLAMSGLRRKEENLAARIAPEILRFHVLANSDSSEDQEIKLEVKSLLLDRIQQEVTADSRESVETYIYEHTEELEQIASNFLEANGFSYGADIRMETCEFPQKTYGDMTFPAGVYDAVRVVLGAGEGQNFWCVLYPSLCYLDSTYAVVPDESKDALKSLVSEDDFQALLAARKGFVQQNILSSDRKKTEQTSRLPRLNIRFKILDFLNSD